MQHIPRRKSRSRIIVASVSVVVLAGLVAGGLFAWRTYTSNQTTVIGDTDLKFRVLLPGGKGIDSVNGQALIPPTGAPYFVYLDRINNVDVQVTEQQLPASFKNDVNGQVAQVAKSYNATDSVKASGTTAYIGTNINGPQSVILTKQSLLVLIKSQATISDKAWVNYLSSLH